MLLLMPSSWFISSFAIANDFLLSLFFFLPARCPFLFFGALLEGPAGAAEEAPLKLDPGFGAAIVSDSSKAQDGVESRCQVVKTTFDRRQTTDDRQQDKRYPRWPWSRSCSANSCCRLPTPMGRLSHGYSLNVGKLSRQNIDNLDTKMFRVVYLIESRFQQGRFGRVGRVETAPERGMWVGVADPVHRCVHAVGALRNGENVVADLANSTETITFAALLSCSYCGLARRVACFLRGNSNLLRRTSNVGRRTASEKPIRVAAAAQ